MKINCLDFVEKIRSQQNLKERKRLVVFQVGNNPASDLYVLSKIKEAEKWNVEVNLNKFDDISTEELINLIEYFNKQDNDGIIVQLPLPKHIDTQKVLNAIDPTKNVDGFKQDNRISYYEPCTPLGIMMLLKGIEPNLNGKFVTLVGRGKTIGEPLRDMLLKENVTLGVCHSHTKKSDLYHLAHQSDVVILATGIPNLITCCNLDTTKKDPIVIDAGISRINGKQVGDFNHEVIYENVKYTPWVNGVGKLTVMALMLNVRKEVVEDE